MFNFFKNLKAPLFVQVLRYFMPAIKAAAYATPFPADNWIIDRLDELLHNQAFLDWLGSLGEPQKVYEGG